MTETVLEKHNVVDTRIINLSRFGMSSKHYKFDGKGQEFEKGQYVFADTVNGRVVAKVIKMQPNSPKKPTRSITGLATTDDYFAYTKKLIDERNNAKKLVIINKLKTFGLDYDDPNNFKDFITTDELHSEIILKNIKVPSQKTILENGFEWQEGNKQYVKETMIDKDNEYSILESISEQSNGEYNYSLSLFDESTMSTYAFDKSLKERTYRKDLQYLEFKFIYLYAKQQLNLFK